MRAGGCTVQQTLTAEAAGVLKHAVALARQRGHSQVTPLHVAATLLAPGTSLLRRACLKSHPHSTSHPLQCRALELCFKVALNRLPTTAAPLVHGQPSLSNALVAALKRAQAHQRRGCLEQQQQQPLLAVKVEMEQLIISILDDPSVSRVMREAGFSSTFVKNNLEESSVSVSISSLTFPCSSALDHHNTNNHPDVSILSRSASYIKGLVTDSVDLGNNVLYASHNDYVSNTTSRLNIAENNPSFRSLRTSGRVKEEDVESVLEVFLRLKTRRNAVIVGDCFLTTENVVREVIMRIERGNNVAEPLRGAQIISPNFPHDTRRFSREHVEQKLADLRRAVSHYVSAGPVIIYAGDLKWTVDVHEQKQQQQMNNDDDHIIGNNRYQNISSSNNSYCAVEHISMELGRILASHIESGRLWIMATATYQTYLRCQMRQPSLETLWGLQAVSVPSGGLTLTLETSSTSQPESKNDGTGSDCLFPNSQNVIWAMPPLKTTTSEDDSFDKISCCSECLAKLEQEAEILREQDRPNLPIWLQQLKNVNNSRDIIDVPDHHVEAKMRELRKKWNQKCRSKHFHVSDPAQVHRPAFESPQYHNTANLVSGSSTPPWWCTSQTQHVYQNGASRNAAWPSPPLDWSHHQFSWSAPENFRDSNTERPVVDVKTTLALGFGHTAVSSDNNNNNNLRTSSVRCSDNNNLRQFDPESLKDFCDRLSEKVPWQSEGNIRAIANSVLQCRCGSVRRSGSLSVKTESWVLALGPDRMGKYKMAQALAEIVFGSKDKLICLGSPWSRDRIDQGSNNIELFFRGKTFLDRFTQAIGRNSQCVVLLEEIEHADGVLLSAISKAVERGKIMDSNGREVSISDAIIFMTSNVGAQFLKTSRSVRGMEFDEEKLYQPSGLLEWGFKLIVQEKQQPEVLQLCKRKSQWEAMEDDNSKRNRKSPALDLNMDVGDSEEVENDQDAGSMTGNSDVTQETGPQTDALLDQIMGQARDCFSQHFLNSLDNCVVFKPFDFAELAESLVERLQNSYRRATNGRGSLQVESSVLEIMASYCWKMAPFGRQTFEKWVEDVFEEGLSRMLSMHTVTANMVVKLSSTAESCSNNIQENCSYGNSGLPGRVEVDPGLHSL